MNKFLFCFLPLFGLFAPLAKSGFSKVEDDNYTFSSKPSYFSYGEDVEGRQLKEVISGVCLKDFVYTDTELPADKMATRETVNLYRNLKRVLNKGIMFGHQDDLAYGVGWKYIPGKSDVKEVTGDYPAVYG